MVDEITIPILPCASIKTTLEFYVALGFEITYQQEKPNTYACIKYEDIDLHFFSMNGYEPKDSYSTCVVLVPDLAGLHQVFSSRLRQNYGKLPVVGIPRMSKLNNSNSDKQLRFNIVDPGGNWVRFVQKGEQPAKSDDAAEKGVQTKLSRATHAADWLIEAVGDFEGAAKTMDKALAQEQAAPPVHRVQALVLRAGIAIHMGDRELAHQILSEARGIELDESDRAALGDTIQRAADLEQVLQ